MPNDLQFVEFIGGPLDGHRSQVPAAPERLETTLKVPISRNIFQVMDGKAPRPAAFPTSTAIYDLDGGGVLPRYSFIKALSPHGDVVGHRRTLAEHLHAVLRTVFGNWTGGAARRAEPFDATRQGPLCFETFKRSTRKPG
ncbi:MAG TPA: hypothetical protein VMV69_03275 [Pirellulales bacterium]|nr:hypothetical protein [Pirellulales bacterium]